MSIISVENLSKSYLIGHQVGPQAGYVALRDVISRNAKSFAKKSFDVFRGRQILSGDKVEIFWALKDVSFEVSQGEVVGIIGRNGAGKSTLLKVLSRITEPTQGRVRLRGRVASLLEVGTGFHPELTGRENIFLNGAILGMSRKEIRRKFDEIVDFAEIERFLDTPVKRYSSGMYVRLAFSVAAHLDPEILIVDEVLAVGDYQFQKKCMGKMQSVSKGGGNTVLFVSHNMGAVRSLCQRAIQLQKGEVVAVGDAVQVTDDFLYASQNGQGPMKVVERLDDRLDLLGLDIAPHVVPSGESFEVTVKLHARQKTTLQEASLIIHSQSGIRVAIVDLRNDREEVTFLAGESKMYVVRIDRAPLMEGLYEVGFYFRADETQKELFAIQDLVVVAGQTSCLVSPYPAQNRGFVELTYRFSIEPLMPCTN